MLQYYTDKQLPPMDFWDMTCVTAGKFYKAHEDIPEGVYVPIEHLAAPRWTRTVASISAMRSGYKGEPDAVFVTHKRGTVRLLCGWLK